MPQLPTSGIGLEARVQRLFLAQGIYAERGLLPSADQNHSMMATDIDVLTSEYASGFHLTKRHAECKGGKGVALLDRVLWLRGVRTLLGADTSYLILANFNEAASSFARSLEVDVLTTNQLGGWEASLGIRPDDWPNRSNFQFYQPLREQWFKLGGEKDASSDWRLIRKAIQFIEIDSWLNFRYGLLNRLFRLLEEVSEQYKSAHSMTEWKLAAQYVASALLVRLAQFLLAVCYDVTRVPMADIDGYLSSRLTFGDQDPDRAAQLIRSTLQWVQRGLVQADAKLPSSVNEERLFAHPQYAANFVELVKRLLRDNNDARYLPLAMDTIQFGNNAQLSSLPRLRGAAGAGDALAALVKGFVISALSIEKTMLDPVFEEFSKSFPKSKRLPSTSSPEQLSLKDDAIKGSI